MHKCERCGAEYIHPPEIEQNGEYILGILIEYEGICRGYGHIDLCEKCLKKIIKELKQ